ncbi:response regulator [Synechococcus sp. CS-1328]|nr:response regulator [Synechococcus sp. CS-1328]
MLVVDDVCHNRLIARIYLQMLGWTVLEADSGHAAVKILQQIRPSHILLDIKMPDIDGISVLKFIRETLRYDDVCVIAYTAHAHEEELRKMLLLGFDSVVVKPILYENVSSRFGPVNIHAI